MNAVNPVDYDQPESGGAGIGWFFNHLPTIIWQRKMLVVWPFVLLTIAATVAAYSLPTIYRSKATLLVQGQQIQSTLVDAPVAGAIEQRIARIRERVLSRGDLIQLIEQNNLYPKERQSKPMSKIVDSMRDATTVGAQANDLGGGSNGGPDTVAIDISFDYPDPALAQVVLQSFVNSFLSMDSEDVSEQARITVRFLQDQANKVRAQLSTVENQLTALKSRNGAALANTGGGGMMVDLGSYSAQITTLENQNRQLLVQSQRTGGKDPQVLAAESALAAAQALYNDSHPDVQTARERLRAVQQMAKSNPGADDGAMIRAQIAANNNAIASLQAARSQAMSRAQAAMAGSARAPAIMEQAMQLENQASALREQYNKVADKLIQAQNSARLANEQRAERLSLIEAPSLPDTPFKPNRPILIAAGAVGGLFLGVILAFGMELLRRPLRSPAQIEGMGLPILGVVPLITEKKPKRWFKLPFGKKEPRFA